VVNDSPSVEKEKKMQCPLCKKTGGKLEAKGKVIGRGGKNVSGHKIKKTTRFQASKVKNPLRKKGRGDH